MISAADARELDLNDGDEAAVRANGDEVMATVVVRTGVASCSAAPVRNTLQEGPVEVGAREAVAG